MWATWEGIRERSLKGRQSSDPRDFHLTQEKRVRHGAGRGIMRQTQNTREEQMKRVGGGGTETIKMLMS